MNAARSPVPIIYTDCLRFQPHMFGHIELEYPFICMSLALKIVKWLDFSLIYRFSAALIFDYYRILAEEGPRSSTARISPAL